jgi:hypothetical protein
MNGLLAVGTLGTASVSFIGTLVSGTVSLTFSIMSYLWHGSFTNEHLRDYQRRIMRLDIPDKIKLVSDRKLYHCGPIAEKIVYKLKCIESQLVYHESKWFSSYRNISIEEDLKDLEALVDVLDNKMRVGNPGSP